MRADQLAVVEMMGEVYAKDRRIAELEAALKELKVEFLAHQEDPRRGVTYKWSLTRIGYALSGSPSALDALLAQARREGIDMAINHLEKSDCPIPIDRLPPGQTKRQFSNTVIEFLILELRQMAREVKP